MGIESDPAMLKMMAHDLGFMEKSQVMGIESA